ncbi:V-set domain-containing T-cell activation inhibitor 1-like [Chanos chanos]|uniref:V-set domain-containing T-cell activation inhibitor 1-like n=1 Tax=Chanos chanos TaxID=29144 RepID=A0A6J2W3B8_CHACN|nr:V-set domain-containing T-cell activation inhibitor 1-like [Chanos chanos]
MDKSYLLAYLLIALIDKDIKNVYDVTSGNAALSQQDPQFQNRAQTFPEEYVNGNFSLKLNNLDLTDTGKYSCYVPYIRVERHLELHVKDIVIERLPPESSPAEKSDPAGRSDSVKTSPVPALVLFLTFLCSQTQQFV